LHPFALRLVSIPWWSMTLLTAVASAALAARALRHRGRLHSGRCINCGYDLRATPGRCPECGDAPERLTAAAAAATTTTARAGESGEALRPPLGITVGTDEQILGILNGGGLRTRPPRR
jgi:hypothetical protein